MRLQSADTSGVSDSALPRSLVVVLWPASAFIVMIGMKSFAGTGKTCFLGPLRAKQMCRSFPPAARNSSR